MLLKTGLSMPDLSGWACFFQVSNLQPFARQEIERRSAEEVKFFLQRSQQLSQCDSGSTLFVCSFMKYTLHYPEKKIHFMIPSAQSCADSFWELESVRGSEMADLRPIHPPKATLHQYNIHLKQWYSMVFIRYRKTAQQPAKLAA